MARTPSRSRNPEERWAPTKRFSLRRARKVRMLIQIALLLITLLVILPLWLIYKPPRSIINYFARRFPEVLFHLPTEQKILALTIDDTPSQYTSHILQLLVKNDVTATFFVIGGQVKTPEDEDMLADLVRQGNELGNHAMHDEPTVRLASDILTAEIAQVDAIIERAYKAAGRLRPKQKLFRPGSGFFSRRILDVIQDSEHETILGDIFPHDPFVSFWRLNAWHVLSSLRPGGIIIVHDRRSWTPPLLAKILPTIKRRGYQVAGLSKALECAGD